MELTVRAAVPDDAAAIAGILNPIIAARVYTVLDAPFTVAEERAFIEQFPSRGVFHVAIAKTDGRVVGFQNVEPFADLRAFDHVGVIGTWVDLQSRRRGVATRLFEETFAVAAQKGYRKLFAYVRSDNPAALAAYQRHGFDIIGLARQHARIDDQYVDETLIERQLAGVTPHIS